MKSIDTNGIAFLEAVPGATDEWYYALGRECGDLYEAEERFRDGKALPGNELYLIKYPEGEVYPPVAKKPGAQLDSPVFFEGGVFFLQVSFPENRLNVFRFDCAGHDTVLKKALPLSCVRNCYNLRLHASPLCLARQGDEGVFEIVFPERVRFELPPRESFFLREGEKLYFSRWYEEGEGESYRYYEETAVRDLNGDLIGLLPGDVRVMPDGEIWHVS